MTLRRVVIQKEAGLFTEEKKASVAILATLNASSSELPAAQAPSVNPVPIEDMPEGQVALPLEYPIASLLSLPQDSPKNTYTKNMLLDVYVAKKRGKNTFGKVLDLAGQVLARLPIPESPYTNAANQVLKFANDAIKAEAAAEEANHVASVTLQFNNKDQADIQRCKADGFEATGAIAIVGPKGPRDGRTLPLHNLERDYCWRYSSENTYAVEYAQKPPDGECKTVAEAAFSELPNDYVMVLVSAAKIESPFNPLTSPAQPKDLSRMKDLERSVSLCKEMSLSAGYCGVQ
jgi:hypothetical protein